ncbi:MAG: protein translocase subunit SecF [Deltaproteobacteria bacterium]|nr:protein translocase subunit SecF [Deltaproteobacteria bacterium]
MLTIPIRRQFPFIAKQWYFIALSLCVLAAAGFAMAQQGLNYGVDFRGGIKLTLRIPTMASDGDVTAALTQADIAASVQHLGQPADHRFLVKLGPSEAEVVERVTAALPGATIEGQEMVGPRVGSELKKKGQAAILFTLLALLIYIGFRFDFYFAPGAIVALLHDVIVTMGFLAWFRREFDLTILAALLTIVGYSINDTIIIYDRIREHAREITPTTIETVVNRAINDTLARTIVTSLTVLFVVVILYVTTQGVIQNFAFAFIVGVISGSYSTIFIASPIYIWLYKRFPQWRKN